MPKSLTVGCGLALTRRKVHSKAHDSKQSLREVETEEEP